MHGSLDKPLMAEKLPRGAQFVSVGHGGRGLGIYPPPGQNLTDDVDQYGPKGSLLGDSHPNSDYPFVLRRADITFAWVRAQWSAMGLGAEESDEHFSSSFSDVFPVKVGESDFYKRLVFLIGERCVLGKYPYPSPSCERSRRANARCLDRDNLVPEET